MGFTQKSEEKTSISEEIVNTDPVSITIEKERLEKERKEREKQKKKERIDKLKAEGKYLTAKQKEEKARATQMLEALKEKGVVLPVPTEDKPKKRVVYTNKKKKFTQKSEEKTSIS